jgi:hypothetical protein
MRLLVPAATIMAPTLPSTSFIDRFLGLGEDHPPSSGLQYPYDSDTYVVVKISASPLYHYHGAIIQETDALTSFLTLLDNVQSYIFAW